MYLYIYLRGECQCDTLPGEGSRVKNLLILR